MPHHRDVVSVCGRAVPAPFDVRARRRDDPFWVAPPLGN